MSPVTWLIEALLPSPDSQRDSDEAFLAEAVDVLDLERRRRELHQHGRSAQERSTLSLGQW